MKIDFFLPGKTTANISFESFNETFSERRMPGGSMGLDHRMLVSSQPVETGTPYMR